MFLLRHILQYDIHIVLIITDLHEKLVLFYKRKYSFKRNQQLYFVSVDKVLYIYTHRHTEKPHIAY